MAKARLTDTRIADFSPTREEWLMDTESHLAVRGRPSGSKTYVFRSMWAYREIKITIGEVGAVALPDARAKAREWQGMIEGKKDPREVIHQQTEAKAAAQVALAAAEQAADLEAHRREAPALEAWTAYVEARRPKWGAHMIHDHERVSRAGGAAYTRGPRTTADDTKQPGILRPLLALPLDQLDGERVRAWLVEEAARRPTHAALAFRLLRGFLNWCASRPEYADLISADACAARSVRDEIPKKRVKDDCLQREQLQAWFEKVRAIPNPVIATFLQTSLLVGARREEVAGLRWVDVQFQWNTIHLVDKVEGERVIPLTPYVASLLAALPHRNEWVFSSPAAASGRLQEPSIQHRRPPWPLALKV